MEILFHGTTKENSKNILKSGFHPNTYFSKHLEDAIHMGGDYIFEVLFEENTGSCWEYITKERIDISKILNYYSLEPNLIWRNKECERRVKEISIKEEYGDTYKICNICNGRGQIEDYDPFIRWINKIITACDTCKGFGAVPVDL